MIDYKKIILLNEGRDANLRNARNSLHVLYEHLLKFQFAPHKQQENKSSWKTSIIETWVRMMEYISNEEYKRIFLNSTDFVIENEYKKGLIKAEKFNKEIEFPQTFKEFYTLEDLTDMNFLYNFIIKYSYSDDIRNYYLNELRKEMHKKLKIKI